MTKANDLVTHKIIKLYRGFARVNFGDTMYAGRVTCGDGGSGIICSGIPTDGTSGVLAAHVKAAHVKAHVAKDTVETC